MRSTTKTYNFTSYSGVYLQGTVSSTTTSALSATRMKHTMNRKAYEQSNHLGNVLVTVSDARQVSNSGAVVTGFIAIVKSASDYSAFGAPMTGRTYTAASYRYDFNGKETDHETDLQDYGFRIYNPRLGKFLSVDPITSQYPELTPYQFASNRPIDGIDLEGLEWNGMVGGGYVGAPNNAYGLFDANQDGITSKNELQTGGAILYTGCVKYPLIAFAFATTGPVGYVFLIPSTGLTVAKDIASVAPEEFPGAASAPSTATGAVMHVFDAPGEYQFQGLGDIAEGFAGMRNAFSTEAPLDAVQVVDQVSSVVGVVDNTAGAVQTIQNSQPASGNLTAPVASAPQPAQQQQNQPAQQQGAVPKGVAKRQFQAAPKPAPKPVAKPAPQPQGSFSQNHRAF